MKHQVARVCRSVCAGDFTVAYERACECRARVRDAGEDHKYVLANSLGYCYIIEVHASAAP